MKLHQTNAPSRSCGHVFRIGIVGCGRIAELAHLPAVLQTSEAVLTALVDPQIERAEELRVKHGLRCRIGATVEEVLDVVDAVIIATPNNTHAAVALSCLARRVHTLIEKPIATELNDAAKIVQASVENGVTVGVGFCMRHWHSIRRVKYYLQTGAFGQVRRFMMQYGAVGRWSSVSGYAQTRAAAGGGALVVNGAHYLDRILDWFGQADAIEYQDDAEGGLEANAVATFLFGTKAGEIRGALRLSKSVELPTGCAIETDRGVLLHRDWASPVLSFVSDDNERWVLEEPAIEPDRRSDMYAAQLADFIVACREGCQPLADAASGLECLRLTKDLYACRRPLTSTPLRAEAAKWVK